MRAAGQEVRVDASEAVTVGTPLWIAGTASFDIGEQTLHVNLYINGRLAASVAQAMAIPSPYAISQPFFVGTEATGTPGSYTMTGRLTGQLLAATVRDYAADEAYLTSSVPFDGGPYFGLPDYHDYPLSEGLMPMDQRIMDNPSTVRRRFFVPYVDDEFVPQGTATHVSDEASLVYLSYYHLTRSGMTGQRRSMIAEMDAETGHVRRTFRLMGELGFSHAGGIAYVDGAIYVSSAGTLERYPLPLYDPDASPYIDLEADASGTISVYGRASFVSAHRDTLWVGDWRTVEPGGAVPLRLPARRRRQAAAAATRRSSRSRAASRGSTSSIHAARRTSSSRGTGTRAGGGRDPPRAARALARWVEPAIDSTITVPYGIEDLSFFPDGSLWTNSESSADYYQRGSAPGPSFYPFVYRLPAEAVLGDHVATGHAERPDIGEVRLDGGAEPVSRPDDADRSTSRAPASPGSA